MVAGGKRENTTNMKKGTFCDLKNSFKIEILGYIDISTSGLFIQVIGLNGP